MVKITFKSVGQGDSIIIEWNDKIPQIGIVDCNITISGSNPVLEHVKDKEYKEIAFIVLSHPHYDHFSGLNELLRYCEANNIWVRRFVFTAYMEPAYLKAVIVNSKEILKELYSLFTTVIEFSKFKQNPTKLIYVCHDDMAGPWKLNEKVDLKFLLPSHREINHYVEKVQIYSDEEDVVNNARANWLSTLIKISFDEKYILLTSDVEKSALYRVFQNYSSEFSGKLVLGQTAHHGSWSNVRQAFWKKLDREPDTPIVISVGKNGYRHPSDETISFFQKNDYHIHSTAPIGKLAALESSVKAIKISDGLDVISSEIVKDYKGRFSGDQVFEFN